MFPSPTLLALFSKAVEISEIPSGIIEEFTVNNLEFSSLVEFLEGQSTRVAKENNNQNTIRDKKQRIFIV
jgi:hypothetical protein